MRPEQDAQDALGVRPVAAWVATAETAILAGAVPALGLFVNGRDPFFVQGPVSWPLFAPMLAGLRYGFAAGFGCAVTLAFALVACWRTQLLVVPVFPGQLIVALLLAGMGAGELADLWISRLRRTAALNGYQRQRFGEFARNYHLLKVSHDAMEEQSAASGGSLRNALAALRGELLRSRHGRGPLGGAGRAVLELFEAFGQVQVASLHPVTGGRLGPAVATLGAAPGDLAADPLVHKAIATGQVASLDFDPGADPGSAGSALVAAVPCVDSDDRLWAVVAVRDMPFFALTAETLRLLALIGGHVADTLGFGAGVEPAGAPDVLAFEREVKRCLADTRRHKLPASVVVFAARDVAAADRVLPGLLEERRGLDAALLLREPTGGARLFVLLPLTDGFGVGGYLTRVSRAVKATHGLSAEEAGLTVVGSALLGSREATQLLADLRTLAGPALSLEEARRHGARA